MTLATVALAPAYNPGSWSTFFVLTGTVAATLTGLFFVAFSLRVRDLQLSVVIRTRAAYLLALLVVIVVYSAFVLMPGQSRAAVAAEILIVSVVSVAATVPVSVKNVLHEPGLYAGARAMVAEVIDTPCDATAVARPYLRSVDGDRRHAAVHTEQLLRDQAPEGVADQDRLGPTGHR